MEKTKMKLGNTVIFGDSYSTFSGYIPDGYAVYYTKTREIPDVRRVEDTWWYPLCAENEGNILRNDSWSGSTVCYTGYNGVDCSASSSFIYRINKLESEGFFRDNKIDTVFVFGATNDSWANSPLGELKLSDWENGELYSVLPAIGYFLRRVKELASEARIVCVINTDLKSEIINAFITACENYGIQYVKLENIDKMNGHPSVKGMESIKNQIKAKLG